MNKAIIKDAQERLHGECLAAMDIDFNAGGLAAVQMALCHILKAQYHLKNLCEQWQNANERLAWLEEAARIAPWSTQIMNELAAARGEVA